MSIFSRLFGRNRSRYAEQPPVDTLVEEPRKSATRLGAEPQISPWSTSRLILILRSFENSSNSSALDEARLARQCLSQFWLQAPIDQLEFLYGSAVGDCYRLLLSCGLAREPLLREEYAWRSKLSERLASAFDRPETPNILLASMPYFAPGKMRVDDPFKQIPSWLLQDYARLFDNELLSKIWQPAGLLSPAGQAYGRSPALGLQRPSTPETNQVVQEATAPAIIPRLSKQRGAEALATVQQSDFVRRMSGLINLFVIDPSDQQVIDQLIGLRRLLGQIWLDAQPAQIEALYASSHFGRLYQELLTSGFSRLSLSEEDRFLRNQLAGLVADMSQPMAINALMAVLSFYPPGKIAFGGGELHLPDWLTQQIETIYGSKSNTGSAEMPNPEA